MKTLFTLCLTLFALVVSASAQTALTATTLSAAITSSTRVIPVASVTGLSAGYTLVIDNEAMQISSVGTSSVTVAPRGYQGTVAVAHVTGAMVLVGPGAAFLSYDPSGAACTNGTGLFLYSPIINLRTGGQFLCSSVTGKVVPGFQNTQRATAPTAVVASAASKITPSGPLFHVSGTAAVTGFNIPVGFDPSSGGQICAIPDAIFTTTTANNFALASTAVVGKPLCWTYDPASTKFYPSY